jgi:small-conductance mechanosensitive channel
MSRKKPGIEPDRIDLDDAEALAEWAKKLDTTQRQLREAIAVVGNQVSDVEMHLKGVHSTSNADRVRELGG